MVIESNNIKRDASIAKMFIDDTLDGRARLAKNLDRIIAQNEKERLEEEAKKVLEVNPQ